MPKIIDQTKDFATLKENEFNLNCSARGSPTPVLSWTLNEKIVISSLNFTEKSIPNDKLKLQISFDESATLQRNENNEISLELTSNESKSISSAYVCSAVNDFGTDTRSTKVNFQSIPSFPPSSHINDTLNVITGVPVILNCPATGEPKPKINWQMNSTALTNGRIQIVDEGQKLIIFSSKIDDSGTYACVARNTVGVAMRTFPLIVSKSTNSNENVYQLIESFKGENVSLNCSIGAEPSVHFAWTKYK